MTETVTESDGDEMRHGPPVGPGGRERDADG